jgi:hypothetical protein
MAQVRLTATHCITDATLNIERIPNTSMAWEYGNNLPTCWCNISILCVVEKPRRWVCVSRIRRENDFAAYSQTTRHLPDARYRADEEIIGEN